MKILNENEMFQKDTWDQKKRHVLLLNASEEVIRIITWERAAILYFTNKARAPYNYNHVYSIQCSNGKTVEIPTAMVLHDYVNIPFISVKPTRRNIFRRDGLVCQYSGRKLSYAEASIDHVLPTSRGGKHEWGNVVTAFKQINSKKGDRTPQEAKLKLLRKPFTPTRDVLVINSATNEQKEMWNRWITRKDLII